MEFEWFDAARRGDSTFIADNLYIFAGKQNTQGKSALMIAVQHRNNECADLLLAKEARLETDKGWTAIMYAIKYNNEQAFKGLLPLEGTYLTKKNIVPLYIGMRYMAWQYTALLIPHYAKDRKNFAEFFKLAVHMADPEIIRQFMPHMTSRQINGVLFDVVPDHPGMQYVQLFLQQLEQEAERSRAETKRASSSRNKRSTSKYGMGADTYSRSAAPFSFASASTTNFHAISRSSQSMQSLGTHIRPSSGAVRCASATTSTQGYANTVFYTPPTGPASIPPPGLIHKGFYADRSASCRYVLKQQDSIDAQIAPPKTTTAMPTSAVAQAVKAAKMIPQEHTAPAQNFPQVQVGTDGEVYEIIFSGRDGNNHSLPQHQHHSKKLSPIAAPSSTVDLPRTTIRLTQETLLMVAARTNNIELAQASMQYARCTLQDGTTALMIACDKGSYEIAAMLYPHEQKMRRRDGRTALMIAVAHGPPELVAMLMEGETRYQTEDGKTALMIAAMHGRTDLLSLLMPKEARMTDIQRTSALIYAVGARFLDGVRLLVTAEAGMRTRNGSTALCFAAVLGYTDVAEILIPYEYDVTESHGRTPLMLACQSGHLDIARRLSATAMLGATDTRGCTALMECARTGFIEGVELLMLYENRRQNNEGLTALMYAASNGHIDAVKLLMEYELSMQSKDGFTALIYALTGAADTDTKLRLAELLGPVEHSIFVRKGRSSMDYIRDHCDPMMYDVLLSMIDADNLVASTVLHVQRQDTSFSAEPNSPKPTQGLLVPQGSGHASTAAGSMSVKQSGYINKNMMSPNAPGVDIGIDNLNTSTSRLQRESPVESISVQSYCSEVPVASAAEGSTGALLPLRGSSMDIQEPYKPDRVNSASSVSMSIDSNL